ncbi:LysM peptidoglycan-binding domain-containing protein [Bacillus sp. FJAT-45350]|uniref:LysM peptidoglycan-binding domain-containing protein n=1 Tax=Bacillus sp. FJAT-45350 TaxID=2011014 RepID=UPI000BB6897B|nr:LysM peptidoglycan-binding domain-containing protein [Bacillus sp. FJAT-45350]
MKKLLLLLLIVLFIPTKAFASNVADRIVETGKQYIGTPYQYGAPLGNTSSFDCSSFSAYIFGQHGITLPRVSQDQARVGTAVSKGDLRKGDLIFYDTNFDGRINHLGVYMNSNEMIHASSSQGVHITRPFSPYWEARFVSATRVISNENSSNSGTTYTVKAGDTLFLIARSHQITVEQLKQWNQLNSDTIFVGQQLTIVGPNQISQSPNTKMNVHTVAPGDSLWTISRTYGVSIDQIIVWNSLTSTVVHPGQSLFIQKPTTVTTEKLHVVQAGESLWLIATKYNMSIIEVMTINNLTTSTIFPGQSLKLQ